jgi:membrane-bound ClpP family serine protease
MMTAVQVATICLVLLVVWGVLVPIAKAALRARSRKRCLTPQPFVGLAGESETALAPTGHVVVRGELWEAIAEVPAPRGARVRVVGADGTRLRVAVTASDPGEGAR